ncbi:MAG TPA: FtsQ-type POTRA domain-containing protein [Pyrinomonadaceae bacterium]|nr:FtsQ-type POTRA domain-containing protein [Pyrinomonadaceae bacterium]
MREQIINQRVGNRSGIQDQRRGGSAQRRKTGKGEVRRMRSFLSYVPALLKVIVAIAIGALLFWGYSAAAAARFFQLRDVEIQGNARASVEDVRALVKREVAETGVWRADVAEISAELERLPWVRQAIVSRVLPDGIRVRLTERQPRAVARMTSGRFVWVDEDAVTLGEMKPTDQMPAFFLRGWNEDGGETARKENSERVKKFLTLMQEWNNAGLAERISEVNLIDMRDVRAQLAGDDSQIEIRLGSQDFLKRLKDALNVLDEHRQTPRGRFISYVDLTQGKRAIVGFMSGAHAMTQGIASRPKE